MYIEHRIIANEKKEMIKSIDTLNESRMTHLKNRNDLKKGLVSQEELDASLIPTIPTLSIVLRADVHGSLEAIQGAIQGLPQHQVKVVVASCGVGEVTSSDIDIAASTQCIYSLTQPTLLPSTSQQINACNPTHQG
jgi:translation initiation factor IF-2